MIKSIKRWFARWSTNLEPISRPSIEVSDPNELEYHQCEAPTLDGEQCRHKATRIIRVGPVYHQDDLKEHYMLRRVCAIHHRMYIRANPRSKA